MHKINSSPLLSFYYSDDIIRYVSVVIFTIKLIKYIGQPFCLILYAVSAHFAAKKKPLPLIILFMTHLSEYFIIGRKAGKENCLSPINALIKCLSFGFTWWLPLRKSRK